jgi:class 3 adenylate cyclase
VGERFAARLTSHSGPNEVLVDERVTRALAADDRFTLMAVSPIDVQGYPHLECWRVDAGHRDDH